MEDGTIRTQTRQSVARHKVALAIYALMALVGIIGWLASL